MRKGRLFVEDVELLDVTLHSKQLLYKNFYDRKNLKCFRSGLMWREISGLMMEEKLTHY